MTEVDDLSELLLGRSVVPFWSFLNRLESVLLLLGLSMWTIELEFGSDTAATLAGSSLESAGSLTQFLKHGVVRGDLEPENPVLLLLQRGKVNFFICESGGTVQNH